MLHGCVWYVCCYVKKKALLQCAITERRDMGLYEVALWYVLLVCHQYDVCENSVGSVYVGGYGGLSKSGLCVFCKLCPVCFLVVGKGPLVLL